MPEKKFASIGKIKRIEGLPTKVCLGMIKFYRLFISPIKPQVCRYYPSCSQYTYEAVAKYGFNKGIIMGIKRVIRCHPFSPGGYHPVD